MVMSITFENAIEQTQYLLSQIEFLDTNIITQKFTELVSTENGARGFFVTYLTSDLSPTEYPSLEVITALKTSPILVNELLVKNLANLALVYLDNMIDYAVLSRGFSGSSLSDRSLA